MFDGLSGFVFWFVFFFFSSRRRHTRLQGDWSSDVCSSDLQRSCSKSCFGLRPPKSRGPIAFVSCSSAIGPKRRTRMVTRLPRRRRRRGGRSRRSEEHTSELQSPCNLVCRLLLEKKNTTHILPSILSFITGPLAPRSPHLPPLINNCSPAPIPHAFH